MNTLNLTTRSHNYSNNIGVNEKIHTIYQDFWSDLTNGFAHSSNRSIFGVPIPDIGMSEAYADFTGIPRTYQDGSNLWGDTPQSPQQKKEQQIYQQNLSTGGISGITSQSSSPYNTNNLTGGPYTGGNGQVLNTQTSQPSGPSAEQLEAQRREREARNAIESGYAGYFSQLDEMMNGLTPQRQSQESIVNNSYNQSISDLGAVNEDNMRTIDSQRRKTEENQVKTLSDLADNIRNQYMAGNVYLGARGAGDSSAANMYSYALNKIGSKQRGDIMGQTASTMNDIADREARLKGIYTQEVSRLDTEKNNQIAGIAQWFAEQQNNLRGMKAQGQLSKGQDLATLSQNLLNQALSKLNEVETNTRNRRNALDSWAMSNSQNLAQLKQNMSGIANMPLDLPGFAPINGAPQVDGQGNINALSYFGNGSNDEEDQQRGIFG